MRKAIVAIMLDTSLSEAEKAQRRQALMAGKWAPGQGEEERGERGGRGTRARGHGRVADFAG